MVTSLTGKGVVVIGGKIFHQAFHYTTKRMIGIEGGSNALLELSGDSKDSLKWTVLGQTLQFPRKEHVSFTIPNEIASELACSKNAISRKRWVKDYGRGIFVDQRTKNKSRQN